MYWFTSDQHFGHTNILQYCKRPFHTIEEMNVNLIERFNSKVKEGDTTIHCGDFTLKHNSEYALSIIKQLNGNHIFIKGSHDRWMDSYTPSSSDKITLAGYLYERKYNNNYIVACHYAMRVWPRSHFGSIQVYGHSHGNLPAAGKQMDVGVDTNYYYPISINEVITITNYNFNQGITNGKAFTSSGL